MLKKLSTANLDPKFSGSYIKKSGFLSVVFLLTRHELYRWAANADRPIPHTSFHPDLICCSTNQYFQKCEHRLGYDMTPDDVMDEDQKILTYHRIVEAFRFAYAKRSSLGDERNNPNITEVKPFSPYFLELF